MAIKIRMPRRTVVTFKALFSFGFLYLLFALPALRTEEAGPLHGGLFTQDLTAESRLFNTGEALNLDEVTRLAIVRNLDIGMLQLENQGEGFELGISKSIYDSRFNMFAEYVHDREQTPNIVFGDRQLRGIAGVSLEKLLPTGTWVKIEGATERNSTNSPFVTLSRYYDSYGSLEFNQPLLKNAFGYIDRKRVQQVKINVKRFDYQTLDGIEELLYGIRLEYWDLKFAFENLRARLKALRKAQDFFQITHDKLDVGLTEKPDVFAAEANVRTRVLEVLEAENEVKSKSENLRILLNLPEVPLVYPSEELSFKPVEVDVAEALEKAYENRRDLKQLEIALESQTIEKKIRANERLPDFSFDGGYTSNGLDRKMSNSQGEVFGFQHPRYYAGFHFNASLENREARGRFSQAEIEYKRLEKEMHKLKLSIRRDVENSHRGLLLAAERVRQTENIKELQFKKISEEEKNFNRGRSSSKTIIDFQDDLIEAEINHIRALMMYNRALEDFYRATHGLIEKAGIDASTIPAEN